MKLGRKENLKMGKCLKLAILILIILAVIGGYYYYDNYVNVETVTDGTLV